MNDTQPKVEFLSFDEAYKQDKQWQVGDTVHVKPFFEGDFSGNAAKGRTFVIEKLPRGANGVNYIVRAIDGGRGLRAAGYVFAEGPHKDQQEPPAVIHAPLLPGTVVTCKAPRATGLWVVGGETAKGYKIFRLGGGQTAYFHNIPRTMLEEVPLSALGGML